MKNKITVELCDKEFSLLSDEPEDYVQSLAEEINKMIEDIAYKNLRVSKADAAVLTCLNLCDKNRKHVDNNDSMRREIMKLTKDIEKLTIENIDLTKKLAQKPAKPLKTPDNTANAISIADDSKDS